MKIVDFVRAVFREHHAKLAVVDAIKSEIRHHIIHHIERFALKTAAHFFYDLPEYSRKTILAASMQNTEAVAESIAFATENFTDLDENETRLLEEARAAFLARRTSVN